MIAKADKPVNPSKIIRDKDFAARLDKAVASRLGGQDGHGRQKWLRLELERKTGSTMSPEAVRKWFAGEARPRPKVMVTVAEILEVDPAWLSMGVRPTQTPTDKKRHNALASGATNLVAGLIQLSGGNIAFPRDTELGYDFMAIIDGKSYAVQVKYAEKTRPAQISVEVGKAEGSLVLLISGSGAQIDGYDIYRIDNEFLTKHGKKHGAFLELKLKHDHGFHADGDYLPIIKDFKRLQGEVPKRQATTNEFVDAVQEAWKDE